MQYSKNKKLNGVLNHIESELNELGIDEVKRYMDSFPRETDYNIAQYGNLTVYYVDVRRIYTDNGYKTIDRMSDFSVWETYKRQVGYVARKLANA